MADDANAATGTAATGAASTGAVPDGAAAAGGTGGAAAAGTAAASGSGSAGADGGAAAGASGAAAAGAAAGASDAGGAASATASGTSAAADGAAKTAPAAAAAAGVPEKYDLKLPEHAVLDATAIERTAAHARELGLSNDVAQKVLELANTEAAALRDAFLASHSAGDPDKNIAPGAAWVAQQDEWKAAAMADPEIGGTPEQFQAQVLAANKAFDKFATPLFREHVWKTGLASHPEVVRVFARIGKAMGEGSVVVPGAQGAGSTQSAADLLYGGKKE